MTTAALSNIFGSRRTLQSPELTKETIYRLDGGDRRKIFVLSRWVEMC